ncbi:hypothetical protein IJX73_01750 [bacterium]|nr:hypothetical protein [bacterium]MBQ9149633.1 hypothetical protein [bacterium]
MTPRIERKAEASYPEFNKRGGAYVPPEGQTGEKLIYGGYINGKLDEEYYQGERGDCVLLSFFESMSATEKGAKLIENSISSVENEDGYIEAYQVYFSGIDKYYEVSTKEISDNLVNKYTSNTGYSYRISPPSNYSYGDIDALLLELACEKALKENTHYSKEDVLSNVDDDLLYKLYMGEEGNLAKDKGKSSYYYVDTRTSNLDFDFEYGIFPNKDFFATDIEGNTIEFEQEKDYSTTYNHFSKENTFTITQGDESYLFNVEDFINTYYGEKGCEIDPVLDSNFENEFITLSTYDEIDTTDTFGNDIYLYNEHMYAVKKSDEDTLILTNPHDARENITLDKETLKNLYLESKIAFYTYELKE